MAGREKSKSYGIVSSGDAYVGSQVDTSHREALLQIPLSVWCTRSSRVNLDVARLLSAPLSIPGRIDWRPTSSAKNLRWVAKKCDGLREKLQLAMVQILNAFNCLVFDRTVCSAVQRSAAQCSNLVISMISFSVTVAGFPKLIPSACYMAP